MLARDGSHLLTNNYVVDETATRLRNGIGPAAALGFRQMLLDAVAARRLRITWIDEKAEAEREVARGGRSWTETNLGGSRAGGRSSLGGGGPPQPDRKGVAGHTPWGGSASLNQAETDVSPAEPHPEDLVEVRGLEPLASSVRGKRSTGLSYTPRMGCQANIALPAISRRPPGAAVDRRARTPRGHRATPRRPPPPTRQRRGEPAPP